MVRYVYVLEDDEKTQIEILESLQKIDPALYVRFFSDLEQFANWMQLLMKEGPKAIHRGGKRHPLVTQESELTDDTPSRLALIVSKNEILGSQNIPLLRKTGDLFVKVGLATKEDPTSIVITAFDNPNFDIKLVEDRIINNLIFKPFDKLILAQHLTFALDGRHPPSSYTIHNMKTEANIEMLKDVHIEAVSHLGFVTRSNRQIDPGKIAKYYSDFFTAGNTRSMMAYSYKCEVHPQYPQEFLCSFLYYGAVTEQINSMRKYFLNKKLIAYEYDWNKKTNHQDTHFVIIDNEEGTPSEISANIRSLFKNVNVVGYKSYAEFLVDLDPSQYAKVPNQPKAFPIDGKFKIIFDELGQKIMKTEPQLTEAQSVLSFKATEFMRIDMRHFVESSSKNRFRHILDGSATAADEKIFSFRHGDFQFFLKEDGYKVVDDQGKKQIEIAFAELNENERKQWLMKTSRLPKRVDAVFCRDTYFKEGAEERWKNITESLRGRLESSDDKKNYQPQYFMISEKRLSDTEVRTFGHYAVDVFYKPLERQYIANKLKTLFSQLELSDPMQIVTSAYTSMLEVGNPVQITEMSEAGVVMDYYRSISVGSFRKFVLWMPQEIGAPIYHASCNFFEEKEKGKFSNHFVFFGMSDAFLKHIRLWIRDSYIHSKGEKGG